MAKPTRKWLASSSQWPGAMGRVRCWCVVLVSVLMRSTLRLPAGDREAGAVLAPRSLAPTGPPSPPAACRHTGAMSENALGTFLRQRREAVTPEQVGLPRADAVAPPVCAGPSWPPSPA